MRFIITCFTVMVVLLCAVTFNARAYQNTNHPPSDTLDYHGLQAIVPCEWGISDVQLIERSEAKAQILSQDEAPFIDNMFADAKSIVELDMLKCESCLQALADLTVKTNQLTSARVYFDAESGNLIKAVFEMEIWDDSAYVEFTAEQAEARLLAHGERYYVLDDSIKTSLFTAIRHSFAVPLRANKTVIQLVNWKPQRGNTIPVWIVQGIGIDPPVEPIGFARGARPLYQFTRQRKIISAQTGKMIVSTTIPAVSLKPEDR